MDQTGSNNKIYGYQPKVKKGAVGVPHGEDLGLVNVNPYEFSRGMDYELTSLGCARLRESSIKEREQATEKVLKNLNTHPAYYSGLLHYQAEYRNSTTNKRRKPSFNTWLKEFFGETQMKPVDQTYKNDKMVTLKEAIKKQIRKDLKEQTRWDPNACQNEQSFCCINRRDQIMTPAVPTMGIHGGLRCDCPHGFTQINCRSIREAKDKDDWSDIEDREATVTDKEIRTADLKGLQDAVLDTKEALSHAQQTVKELGPDIKKLAKEVNSKIKKNPAKKSDYLKVYQSDPDVKEFIKLRRMLKSADLL